MKTWAYCLLAVGCLLSSCQKTPSSTSKHPVSLRVGTREIEVDGKKTTVYCLVQPDGSLGLKARKGDLFDVYLHNSLEIPTSIHWHGLLLPNAQDGVANVTQFPLYPKVTYHYQFPLIQSGTYWMHSHYSLQEQQLLSAPLIIYGSEDHKVADQDHVVFLTDFSFESPESIYEKLRCDCQKQASPMMIPDLVEVKYDAYLANYKTLKDPDILEVQPDTDVRLRFINGSSATIDPLPEKHVDRKIELKLGGVINSS